MKDTIYVDRAVNLTGQGPQTKELQAGEAINATDIVVFSPSGKWVQSNAQDKYEGLMGIAMQDKILNEYLLVFLPGSIIRNDAWSWTPGEELYLSLVPGEIVKKINTPDITDSAQRLIGHALNSTSIFFNPSTIYTTHI